MIVKDEAECLAACLQSVAGLISSWVILDNHSSDDTQNIAKACLAHVPGEIVECDWRGYSVTRNAAISLARRDADYVMMLDADEIVVAETNQLSLPNLISHGYAIECWHETVRFTRPFLFAADQAWEYRGRLHEWPYHLKNDIWFSPTQKIPKLKLVNHGAHRSRNRENEEREKLLKLDLEEFNWPVTYYHLGRLQLADRRYKEAIINFQTCLQDPPSAYHAWSATLSLGVCFEHSNAPAAEVVAWYEKAVQLDLNRAEPIYRLTRLHRMAGDFDTARKLAKVGLDMPIPTTDHPLDVSIYSAFLPAEHALLMAHNGNYEGAQRVLAKLNHESHVPEQLLAELRSALHSMQNERKGLNVTVSASF